ncbi:unnamed protein product [Cochlearia groenlandica]
MVLFLRGALIHQDLKGFNHSDLGHSFPPLDLCVYKQEIRKENGGSDLPMGLKSFALIPCWNSLSLVLIVSSTLNEVSCNMSASMCLNEVCTGLTNL